MAIELEINNLYNYIQMKHTDNTVLFKETFSMCIDELPNYTCSSKIIYLILLYHYKLYIILFID